jgi:hypothetical protein
MTEYRSRQEFEAENCELNDEELDIISGGCFSPQPNPITQKAVATVNKWLTTDEGPNIARYIPWLS